MFILTVMYGLFSEQLMWTARAGLRQMLQQRSIRSRRERDRERGGRHLFRDHSATLCAPCYLSAYASVWHGIRDDPFQCKSGARGFPLLIRRATTGCLVVVLKPKICWHMRSAGRCSQPLCAMKPIAHLSWPHGATGSYRLYTGLLFVWVRFF